MGESIRNQYEELVDPTQPIPVDTVEAQQLVSKSDTITYNGKAAAGAVTVNSVKFKAIMSNEGDQVASYWGLDKNKVYEAVVDGQAKEGKSFKSVVETNGAAALVINDANANLESLFESAAGTVKRYVARVKDTKGGVLYGWIFGVAASGGDYTIDIVNNRLAETRNWVGTLSDFDHTSLYKVEIFKYSSSLAFSTGTTLTEEVVCPREYSKSWKAAIDFASTLSNGQYFVDYMRGRVIGKKADTTASETVTYNIVASTSSATIEGGTSDLATETTLDAVKEAVELANASYTTLVDAGATYTYIGSAVPGTLTSAETWKIKRVTNATGDVEWADSVTTFTKEWDERATYTYA